jgi:hypothetical protein
MGYVIGWRYVQSARLRAHLRPARLYISANLTEMADAGQPLDSTRYALRLGPALPDWRRIRSRSEHTVTDGQGRQIAREIEQNHPSWLVMWGCYSRLFWAFPRFNVPRGTIVSAPEPDRLFAEMQSVEDEHSAREPVYAAPTPVTALPRRLSRGQIGGNSLTGAPSPSDTTLPQGGRYPSPLPVPSPRGQAVSTPRAAGPGTPWASQAKPQPATYDPDLPERDDDAGPYDPEAYEPDRYGVDRDDSHPYEADDPYASWPG